MRFLARGHAAIDATSAITLLIAGFSLIRQALLRQPIIAAIGHYATRHCYASCDFSSSCCRYYSPLMPLPLAISLRH